MTATYSITMAGGARVTTRLEPEFQDALRRIASAQNVTLGALVTQAQDQFPDYGTSAALRCYALAWVTERCGA